jgi:hypothetical protein
MSWLKHNDERIRYYVMPKKIVWHSNNSGSITNSNALLIDDHSCCTLANAKGTGPAIVIDFGEELNGGIRIETGAPSPDWFVKFRIRFGESVSEVMGEPNNDHAIHDVELKLSAFAKHEFGHTGFRFVRLDILDNDVTINLHSVKAIALERPFEYKGSFQCSDELLNQVWKTGARTVHLCCQDYLYDGIKRDRLVWIGDVHPQAHVIAAAFGDMSIVLESLDYAVARWNDNGWLNGISSYTLWWLITLWDTYFYSGNAACLVSRVQNARALADVVLACIDEKGNEKLAGMRFIDWAIGFDDLTVTEGLKALTVWAMQSASKIFAVAGDANYSRKCANAAALVAANNHTPCSNKQVNALRVLTGITDPLEANSTSLAVQPNKGLSTWYGYYVLQARAQAGDFAGCTELIRDIWGGMLSLGATTFWEHFDIDWLENAGRIDEMPQPDKRDVHRDCGDHCYKGLRHSLCHGWAGGPTAWLSRHILGIKPAGVAFEKVVIDPHLMNMEYVRGAFPTPHGLIQIEHRRNQQGRIITEYDIPRQIKVIEHAELSDRTIGILG